MAKSSRDGPNLSPHTVQHGTIHLRLQTTVPILGWKMTWTDKCNCSFQCREGFVLEVEDITNHPFLYSLSSEMELTPGKWRLMVGFEHKVFLQCTQHRGKHKYACAKAQEVFIQHCKTKSLPLLGEARPRKAARASEEKAWDKGKKIKHKTQHFSPKAC